MQLIWDAALGAVRLKYVFEGTVTESNRLPLAIKIEQIGRFLSPRYVIRDDRLTLETHLFLDDEGAIQVWAVGIALSHLESALDKNREELTPFLVS